MGFRGLQLLAVLPFMLAYPSAVHCAVDTMRNAPMGHLHRIAEDSFYLIAQFLSDQDIGELTASDQLLHARINKNRSLRNRASVRSVLVRLQYQDTRDSSASPHEEYHWLDPNDDDRWGLIPNIPASLVELRPKALMRRPFIQNRPKKSLRYKIY